jgi:hypothetical protein
LSACSLAGRQRGRPGRPRGPSTAGMSSISGSNSSESWAFAAERRTASGIPLRSTTRWRFEPGLPRSVGFGPVLPPPFLPLRSHYPSLRGTSLSGRRPPASRAGCGAAAPTRPLAANPATDASRSPRSPSRPPGAGTPTAAPSSARRRSRSDRLDPRRVADHPSASVAPSAAAARSPTTAHRSPMACSCLSRLQAPNHGIERHSEYPEFGVGSG